MTPTQPKTKCPDCGGLGRIDDYPCGNCATTGEVPAYTVSNDRNALGLYDDPAYLRRLEARRQAE